MTQYTLIVENEGFQSRNLKRRLSDCGYLCEKAVTPEDAEELLNQQRFDIAFIDLMLIEGSDEIQGIQIIHSMRNSNTASVIIAYSAIFNSNTPDSIKYEKDCLDAGADMVLSRRELSSYIPQKIKDLVEGFASKNNVDSNVDSIFQSDESLLTLSMVDTVGTNTLSKILNDYIPDAASHHLSGIGDGFSEALVLRVKSFSYEGKEICNNILKLSTKKEILLPESRGKPLTGSPLYLLCVGALEPGKRVGGWESLLFSEVKESKDLSVYLKGQKLPSRKQKSLNRLVSEIAIEPCKSSFKLKEGISVAVPNRISLQLLAKADQIFSLVTELEDYVPKDDIGNIKKFQETLRSGLRDYDLQAHVLGVVWQHGDLHSKNILIDEGQASYLIDFAHSDLYWRTYDVSCLHVDFVLNYFESTGCRDYVFDDLEKWKKCLDNSWPLSNEMKWHFFNKNSALESVLDHLLRSVSEVKSPKINQLEYSASLIIHLVRFISFPSVTIPKKVLGIYWLQKVWEIFE